MIRDHSRNPARSDNRIKQNCNSKSTQSPKAKAMRHFTDELKTSAGGIIAAKSNETWNALEKSW